MSQVNTIVRPIRIAEAGGVERNTSYLGGREAELERIEELRRDIAFRAAASSGEDARAGRQSAHSHITAIIGASGVGKTAILRELERRWKRMNPDSGGKRQVVCDVVVLHRTELDDSRRFWSHVVTKHLDVGRNDAEKVWYAIRRNWARVAEMAANAYANRSFFPAAEGSRAIDQIVAQMLAALCAKHKDGGHIAIIIDREHGLEQGGESELFKSLVGQIHRDSLVPESRFGTFHVIIAGRGDTRTLLDSLSISQTRRQIIEVGELSAESSRNYIEESFKDEIERRREELVSNIQIALPDLLREYADRMADAMITSVPGSIDAEIALHDEENYENLDPSFADLVQQSAGLREILPSCVKRASEKAHVDILRRLKSDELSVRVNSALDRLCDSVFEEFLDDLSSSWRYPRILQFIVSKMIHVAFSEVQNTICVEYVHELEATVFRHLTPQLDRRGIANMDIIRMCLYAWKMPRISRNQEVGPLSFVGPSSGFAHSWWRDMNVAIQIEVDHFCAQIVRDLDRRGCLDIAVDVARFASMVGNAVVQKATEAEWVTAASLAKHDFITWSRKKDLESVDDALRRAFEARVSEALLGCMQVVLSEPQVNQTEATANEVKDTGSKSLVEQAGWAFDRAFERVQQAHCSLQDGLVNQLILKLDEAVDSSVRTLQPELDEVDIDDELGRRLADEVCRIFRSTICEQFAMTAWRDVLEHQPFIDKYRSGTLLEIDLQHMAMSIDLQVIEYNATLLKDGLRLYFQSIGSGAQAAPVMDDIVDHAFTLLEAMLIAKHVTPRIHGYVEFVRTPVFNPTEAAMYQLMCILRRKLRELMVVSVERSLRKCVHKGVQAVWSNSMEKSKHEDFQGVRQQTTREELRKSVADTIQNRLPNVLSSLVVRFEEQCEALFTECSKRVGSIMNQSPSGNSTQQSAPETRVQSDNIEETQNVHISRPHDVQEVSEHRGESAISSDDQGPTIGRISVGKLREQLNAVVASCFGKLDKLSISLHRVLEDNMLSPSEITGEGLLAKQQLQRLSRVGIMTRQSIRSIIDKHLEATSIDKPLSTTGAEAFGNLEALGLIQYCLHDPEMLLTVRNASSDYARNRTLPHYRILIPELLEYLVREHWTGRSVVSDEDLRLTMHRDSLVSAILGGDDS